MSAEDNAFHTTQWTQVLSARGGDEHARDALADLAQSYYAPVLAFLQKEGRDEDAARELCHGFFAWLLSRDALTRLERGRGKFRSYLLGALKHYIGHQRERTATLKRGGGAQHLAIDSDLDPADSLTLPPDREFDRQWALHILAQSLESLREEWCGAGKQQQFEELKPFLDGQKPRGALQALARDTGRSENTLRSQLHRLRTAFRQHVKASIAPTLESSENPNAEMESLLEALG